MRSASTKKAAAAPWRAPAPAPAREPVVAFIPIGMKFEDMPEADVYEVEVEPALLADVEKALAEGCALGLYPASYTADDFCNDAMRESMSKYARRFLEAAQGASYGA